MKRVYWLVCNKFCCGMRVNEAGVIIEAPPFIRKFVGQTPHAALVWTRKNFTNAYMKRLPGPGEQLTLPNMLFFEEKDHEEEDR